MFILVAVAVVAAVAILLVRLKVSRSGIYQNGAYVGSALLAEAVEPGANQARFAIVRGMPAFDERLPFRHAGMTFEIETVEAFDGSSTVLRRFVGVTCWVVGQPARLNRT